MAINNSLTAATEKRTQKVEFLVDGEQIILTPSVVRNYLISGDKDRVTEEEIVMFMSLCRYSKLNPWVKEAYCIKYGNEPATMVVSKEAFQKRAESNAAYDGLDAGIIVLDKNGEITYRRGTLSLPQEVICGGWAEVWRKDRAHSTRIEVSMQEYEGRKKDGTLNKQWSAKPATMIRKVAVAQALREAFPAALGGMFTADEQGVEEMPLIVTPNQAAVDMIPEQEPVAADPEPVPAEDNPQMEFFK